MDRERFWKIRRYYNCHCGKVSSSTHWNIEFPYLDDVGQDNSEIDSGKQRSDVSELTRVTIEARIQLCIDLVFSEVLLLRFISPILHPLPLYSILLNCRRRVELNTR